MSYLKSVTLGLLSGFAVIGLLPIVIIIIFVDFLGEINEKSK